MTFLELSSRSSSLFEHDLFRKPVPTFRDMLIRRTPLPGSPRTPTSSASNAPSIGAGSGRRLRRAGDIERVEIHRRQSSSRSGWSPAARWCGRPGRRAHSGSTGGRRIRRSTESPARRCRSRREGPCGRSGRRTPGGRRSCRHRGRSRRPRSRGAACRRNRACGHRAKSGRVRHRDAIEHAATPSDRG